jgi:GAF domain-containing protein
MTASIDFINRIVDELGPSATSETLVAAVVPEIADSCIVFRRAGNQYDVVASAHIEPAKASLLDEVKRIHHPSIDDPRDPVALVGSTGQGRLVMWPTREKIEAITDDPRMHAIFDAFGPRNIVVVPVRNGDYVLVAAISDTPRTFYEGDLEFFTDLATRVAPRLP